MSRWAIAMLAKASSNINFGYIGKDIWNILLSLPLTVAYHFQAASAIRTIMCQWNSGLTLQGLAYTTVPLVAYN